MNDEGKRCSKCGVYQCITQYSYRNKARGIRRSECKSCQKTARADYFQRRKDFVTANVRAYRSKNKDKVREWAQRDYDKRRDKYLASKRRHREENKDEINRRSREAKAKEPYKRFTHRGVCKDLIRGITKHYLASGKVVKHAHCENCGITKEQLFDCGKYLEIHHLYYPDPSKILTLCPRCHSAADKLVDKIPMRVWKKTFDSLCDIVHRMLNDSQEDEHNAP